MWDTIWAGLRTLAVGQAADETFTIIIGTPHTPRTINNPSPSPSPSSTNPRVMPILAVNLVLLPLESTLLRWRLLPRTLPRQICLSFSRTCFREKSRVSIRHWCIRYPYLTKPSLNLHVHPSSSLQVPSETLVWIVLTLIAIIYTF